MWVEASPSGGALGPCPMIGQYAFARTAIWRTFQPLIDSFIRL
jgi:hypothetical protein